jgi:shikimate kinase
MPSTAPDKRDGSTPAPKPGVERIVLTGFMGSGKSTIGRRLAERLGWRFVDLDQLIEQHDGRTIARIFAESGEPAFRALETEALNSTLREHGIVVALGGGALESPSNREALRNAAQTCTVLLTASFETLYRRCQQQIAAAARSALPMRPLLGDRDAAAARLARREPVYREHANLVLDTTGQQLNESINALLAMLESIF